MTRYHVVIPARMASQRLPGKPLLPIAGKPLIEHVYRRACEATAQSVIIATDSPELQAAAKKFGAEVVMTSPAHESGSDRIAECIDKQGWPDDSLVVNLQGDEPLMPASLITHVAETLKNDKQAVVATSCVRIVNPAEINDPNIVKVVTDRLGHALYFSRAAIPFLRDPESEIERRVFRHIGLYAYRCGFLAEFTQFTPSSLEHVEALEQLRVLWYGGKIAVLETTVDPGHGVDTPDDLQRIRDLLEN